MNRVLSFLLAYAFLQAQTWAIGGGPRHSGSAMQLVGTYAGVLIPVSQTRPSTTQVPQSAAVGLFAIGIPSVSVATGKAVAFVDGIAFIGDVTAVADPARQTLTGLVEAISNFDVITLVPVIDANGNVTFQQVTTAIFAQGNIKAKFEGGGNVDPTGGGTVGGRLTGSSSLDLFASLNADGTPDIFNTVKFRVDGFKQSDTSSTVTLSFNPRGNNNNNNNNP